MPDRDPPGSTRTVLLRVAEAAARLGLTPAGLRSRIRRGAARVKRSNSGQLLVEVPIDVRPVHGEIRTAPEDELRAEVDHLRGELKRHAVP